jgi:glycosyltransferase involved in cell wall biosynthesis
MSVLNPRKAALRWHARGHALALRSQGRLEVEGKFFARGRQRFQVHGVTYGPFTLNREGDPFPGRGRVVDDLARMRAAGINAIRLYHTAPKWLLQLADEQELLVFLDIPWAKHLCFLDSQAVQREARETMRRAGKRGRAHPCVLAYSIANEIPPDIVRWYGAHRIERFLREMMDVAKQADPTALVTYANYPPTEYLDLSFLDFATFNVYLHDARIFRRYLYRLQNLVGDKPLVLGELGMDTLRHGELEQARFLVEQVREATLMGLAGAFIFSWTDEWHTGGHPIRDWAFGITNADRSPKASYHALREAFESRPVTLLAKTPRVSVVVCTFNGAETLEQCLRALLAINYPNYEIIVVDDGSTDCTSEILKRFEGIRVIHQSNHGLSKARNVGQSVATGEIVAYTDSDCFPDPDWLSYLVYQLQCSDASAVGGPNLAPEDGWLAACVAAAPGQPMHVLESNQVAEHIPGCNMAIRRQALVAINGFDNQYRKAGDDVDVCWRLQQAGYWITFAPGAFVWHHRRQTIRAYLRQQAGYGEAEALLRFKHPDRFNGRGNGKWRGVLYGASGNGLRLSSDIIYRGTFGTGLFQCLYQPAPAHWAMLPSTLEWQLATGLIAAAALFWPIAWAGVAIMLMLSTAVAALQAAQAHLPTSHESWLCRLVIMLLCYAQPLVRSWTRYRTRLFAYRAPWAEPALEMGPVRRLPISGSYTVSYWTEQGHERTELLGLFIAYLNEHRWGRTIDSGWENWDLAVYCQRCTVLHICTAQEDHGQGKRLIPVRFRLRAGGYLKLLWLIVLLTAITSSLTGIWSLSLIAGVLTAAGLGLWWRGRHRAAHAVAVWDHLARQLGLVRCRPQGDDRPKFGRVTS